MPVNFSAYRSIPSSIKLNGPFLAYTEQPDNAAEQENRTVVFDAQVEASFIGTGETPDGSYTFKWYLDDVELKDTDEFDVSIFNDGGSSQLTISNIDYTFEGKKVHVISSYTPSGNEGELNNPNLKSDVVTIDALNELEIITQPQDFVGAEKLTANFAVTGRSLPTDDPQRISYQWQMNNRDLFDGLITGDDLVNYGLTETQSNPSFTVTTEDGSESFTIDWTQTSSFKSFTPGKTYTIVPNITVNTKVFTQGAGGGRSGSRNVVGSSGGVASGYVTFVKDTTYKLQVGERGEGGTRIYPESNFEHRYNEGRQETTKLTSSDDIIVTPINEDTTRDVKANDCGDANDNKRHYQVTFTVPMTDDQYKVRVSDFSSYSASTRRGEFSIADIRDKTTKGFKIWFCSTNRNGKFSYIDFIRKFTFRVEGMKSDTTQNGEGGIPGGGSNTLSAGVDKNQSGGGGGYTGLFSSTVDHSNTMIIAGGGGGSSASLSTGGNGGLILNAGETSSSGSDASRPTNTNVLARQEVYGRGGTSSAGGSGGRPTVSSQKGDDGTTLNGGDGNREAGGAGAGYYGGGGGGYFNDDILGGGGGGSSFINSSLVTPNDVNITTKDYSPNVEGDGSFNISFIGVDASATTEVLVSGSNTPNLSLYTEQGGIGSNVRCALSSPKTFNSPLYSEVVSYQSIDIRPILVVEAIDTTNNWVERTTTNLETTPLVTLTSGTYGSEYNLIQFYSEEGDFSLDIDIKASAGASDGNNRQTFLGGQGGVSKIRINIKKDVEYTVIGLAENSAVFLYEKARLIAVVGKGGDAGKKGNGGAGGGVNVDGVRGEGTRPGNGGVRPVSGSLTSTGIYGSSVSEDTVDLYPEDTIASDQSGGRTISCSKGLQYINQGFSPCEDISTDKQLFVDQNGVVYAQSSSIMRGFKAGYTVTETGGSGFVRGGDTFLSSNRARSGGDGGHGATGGNGGTTKSGGGGGSGYVDDSVTVINTTSGGNSDQVSSITFSLSPT